MNFIILKILKIIYFNKMDKGISFKETLGYVGAAAAASYAAGLASGKLSGEQYAKGFKDAQDNFNK